MKLTISQLIHYIIKEQGWQKNFINEYKFHPQRKWLADFADIDRRILVEADGGAFMGKGHTGGKQFISDRDKDREAQLAGWIILHYADHKAVEGFMFDYVRAAKLHGFIV